MVRSIAFLTADSGGSKTKIALYSLEGDLLSETQSKGFGKAVDSDENIHELLSLLKEFTKGYKINRAVINLGGRR